jgi:hypothetical protein
MMTVNQDAVFIEAALSRSKSPGATACRLALANVFHHFM